MNKKRLKILIKTYESERDKLRPLMEKEETFMKAKQRWCELEEKIISLERKLRAI